MDFVKRVWQKWLKVAKIIGNFNGQVLLTIFYLIIIAPLGVVYRIVADPLEIKSRLILKQKSSFRKWEHPKDNLENARRQY